VTHLVKNTVDSFRFFASLFFSLSLHFLATLNTTSSTPRTQSQKVPARQETTTTTTTCPDVKPSKQLLTTKVSQETKQSK
jgi:hypothetical protein